MSDFGTFSPLDLRYRKDLPAILSEEAYLRAQVNVEKVWLLTLMDAGICPKVPEKKIDAALADLGFAEIEEIEKKTQHATRALVEAIAHRLEKAKLKELVPWVHVGLTSFDTVDTAARLRLRQFVQEDFKDLLGALRVELKRLAKAHAKTRCVGRTHGQFAVPSLFGLQFAEALERLAWNWQNVESATEKLAGQSSGAIGGYHASSLLTSDPLKLEKAYLKRLGLQQNLASLQILPPEDIYMLAASTFSLCSVVAKVANDLRHLARSEILEVMEGMGKDQVGSSTMPQKRNPWNLEHVCSLFKVLQSKILLLQVDMVTEHHRDLTNSASSRFYVEFFCVAYLMLKRLTRVLKNLEVLEKNIAKNFQLAGSSVFAEAFYVLGTVAGLPDAHDEVRKAARESEATGVDLLKVAQKKGLVSKGMSLQELEDKVLLGSRDKMAKILKREGES